MRRALLAICLAFVIPAALAATTATITPGTWDLYKGTRVVARGASTQDSCVTAAKATGAGSYSCRTRTGVVVTTDPLPPPPPPTCTTPQPANLTQAGACPAGTTGAWTQTAAYSPAAYPTCWTLGAYAPSSPPAGACSVNPPPPPPPPPPPLGDADKDFAARCVGALVCEGFDDASKFRLVTADGATGLYPIYGTSKTGAMQDTSVKSSGSSSLRFDILTRTGDDPAGHYEQAFKAMAPGSTFYVQWRQRFDTTFATYDWQKAGQSGTDPKQIVLWDSSFPPCTAMELTLTRYYGTNAPIIYSQCGDRAAFGNAGVFNQNGNIQQGDYTCSQNGTGTCLKYADIANKWVTFYEVVKVGALGSATTSVQAFVAVDGGPYKRWIWIDNYTLVAGGGKAFNRAMLTPYMTGKSAAKDHPQAATWYDELIVSEKPIAAPAN